MNDPLSCGFVSTYPENDQLINNSIFIFINFMLFIADDILIQLGANAYLSKREDSTDSFTQIMFPESSDVRLRIFIHIIVNIHTNYCYF